MSVRPWRDIQRKKTRKIKVGNVEVGGDSPISVQSMTNTLTTDIKATVNQIRSLENVPIVDAVDTLENLDSKIDVLSLPSICPLNLNLYVPIPAAVVPIPMTLDLTKTSFD